MKSLITTRLQTIIKSDEWMMSVLDIHRSLDLPDSWIGAGFVRNKVWDVLHDKSSRTVLNDIDVVYFDSLAPKSDEKILEQRLKNIDETINWSVKNQAMMHHFHQHNPYKNTCEAISHWVDTSTAIAIRLSTKSQIEILAPYGLGDLFDLKVRPINEHKRKVMHDRITKKGWLNIWPNLKVEG